MNPILPQHNPQDNQCSEYHVVTMVDKVTRDRKMRRSAHAYEYGLDDHKQEPIHSRRQIHPPGNPRGNKRHCISHIVSQERTFHLEYKQQDISIDN
jgi:hypothetical protein